MFVNQQQQQKSKNCEKNKACLTEFPCYMSCSVFNLGYNNYEVHLSTPELNKLDG